MPAARIAAVDANGAFAVTLPDKGGWRGPLLLVAAAPTGVVVGSRALEEGEVTEKIEIAVTPLAPPTVAPSGDPTGGQRIRLTGRVLHRRGRRRARRPPGAAVRRPRRHHRGLSAAGGADHGGRLVLRALAGGPAGPRLRDRRRRRADPRAARLRPVSRTVVLKVASLPEPAAHDHHDQDDEENCACATTAPPRAPDPLDLVNNPAAFSADRGRCIDVTVPNRTLEEVTFHAVVRTSEPEVKGLTLPDPDAIPSVLTDRLSALVRAQVPAAVLSTGLNAALRTAGNDAVALAAPTASIPSVASVASVASIASIGAEPDRIASELLALRAEVGRPALQLDRKATHDLVRDPDLLTPSHLLALEQDSHTRLVKDYVGVYTGAPVGRFALDASHSIDWDDTPTLHQATTIAHGHLLTFRQVWRADGYSLGDLLYSLPLAPGQKKQIAIVDWDRQRDGGAPGEPPRRPRRWRPIWCTTATSAR